MQFGSILREKCRHGKRGIVALGSGMQTRERLSGDLKHFQSASDALPIVGGKTRGRYGINLGQPLVHGWPPELLAQRRDTFSNRRIRCRAFIHPLSQGFGIQHRAAHQQRVTTAPRDLTDEPLGIFGKCSGAVAFFNIKNIDQMMRHSALFFLSGFGGADIHATIDQSRIDGNDFRGKITGQHQRNGGLAASRRTEKHQSSRFFAHHLPRIKSLSRSASVNCVQVGRP